MSSTAISNVVRALSARTTFRNPSAIAGRMMSNNKCHGRAPRFRATLNQAGSIRRKPCAVENKIGHIAATATRKMMAWSQVANAITAIGIQASGDIILKN